MAYGALRLLYANYITAASMMTASTWATGRVSGSAKIGTGVATMEISGSYAGAYDLSYLAEIDNVSGGTEIGEATFAWRNNLTSGSWEETGVLTRTSPAYALSADGLSTDLSIAHTGGIGDDFALDDSWQWEARAIYAVKNLIDLNRMTTWRSTSTADTITINLGSAQTPAVFLIQDHNLTSSATVKLQGNASDSWGAPSFDYTFSTIEDALIYYFTATQNYQYWRLDISDATNPDGYIEIALMYLGTYTQLNKINAEWGSSEVPGALLQNNVSESGVTRRYYYAAQTKLNLNFGNTLNNADVTTIVSMQSNLIDTSTKRVFPFWVHQFYDQNETARLMDWMNLGSWTREYFAYLLNSGVTFELSEVVKV
jgi:hypothetical protein